MSETENPAPPATATEKTISKKIVRKPPRKRWNFRVRLTLLTSCLITIALFASTLFFLRFYYQDKTVSVYESEFQGTSQTASRLENIIRLATKVTGPEVKGSKDFFLIIDDICTTPTDQKAFASDLLTKSYVAVNFDPRYWASLSAVQGACLRLPQTPNGIVFVNGGPRLTLPYLILVARTEGSTRLAMISMDGLGGFSGAQILLLLDRSGHIVWSEDTVETTSAELGKLGISPALLATLAKDATTLGNPGTRKASADAVVSFAPLSLGGDLVYASVIPETIINRPIQFMLVQAALLAAGLLFICLLAGKIMAQRLSKPLGQLRDVAERLGGGDFQARVEVGGEDEEISIVKRTFNLLAEQIVRFLEETRSKAEMESEIELAKTVQQMFMPKSDIQLSSCVLSSRIKMAQDCGGDWWGYLEIPKLDGTQLLLLLIGDVTGHGTSSALLTAVAQGALSVVSSWTKLDPSIGSDPRQVVNLFNQAICSTSHGSVNMTFFAAAIDFSAGKLYCTNAGHNRPYMLSPGKTPKDPPEIKAIGSTSQVLGTNADQIFDNLEEYPWQKGCQLLLYTDGLLEVIRNKMNVFDRKVLANFLKQNGKLRGPALLEKLMSERAKAAQGLTDADDITVVVCS